jgi:hypothetical protein
MADTARKLELNALLKPIQGAVSGVTSRLPNVSFKGSASATGDGFGTMLFGFSMALLVIFLVLLIIHYAITPVFSFTAGDGGSFPLANTSDGQLVWKEGPPLADLSANIIRLLPHGFTLQQDIYMDNESSLSNRKRIFLYRAMSPVIVDPSQSEDLFTDYPESNLFMYLSPNTNDLVVSAVTVKRNGDPVIESTPTLLNVPIKEVIRVTVVFLPQVLEVYLNGKLHGTRTFRFAPKSTDAYFFSTPDAFRGSVRVMNFKYWDRALTAVEVAKSGPPLADKSLFSPDEMATAQCT